jgi:hypothetical protein
MRIPTPQDDGPALGGAGLMSVRERVGFAQDEIAATLSLQRAGDSIRGLGQDLTQSGAMLAREEQRLALEAEWTSTFENLVRSEDEVRAKWLDPNVTKPDGSKPQPGELRQLYLDDMAGVVQGLHGNLSDPSLQFRLRERGVEMASSGQEYLRREGAQRSVEQGVAQLDSMQEQILARIRSGDEDAADVLSAEYNQRLGALAGVVPDHYLVNMRQALDTASSEARFDSLLAADPTGALVTRMLKEHPEAFPNADTTKMLELAKAAGREGRRTSLFDRWDEGQGTQATLDAAVAAGDLSAIERRYLLKDRADLRAAQIEKQAGHAKVESVLYNGDSPRPFDKDYRKAVDAYWTDVVGPELADQPPEIQLARGAQFVAKTGHVPEAILVPTKGDLVTFSPNAYQASQFMATLRDTAPGVLAASYTESEQAIANSIQTFGLTDPERAVDRAKELATVPKDVRELRVKETRERFKRSGFEPFADAMVDDAPGLFGMTILAFGDRPELPHGMLAEMRAVYDRTYELTGNAKAAERTAQQVVSGEWALTAVTGKPRMARYAPERLYGQPGYGAPEMRRDVLTELVKPSAAAQPELGLTGLSDADLSARVSVEADLFTAQSSHPDYAVTVMTDEGFVPLGRWRPDAETSPSLAADRAETHGEALADARRKRGGDLLLQRLPAMMRSAGEDTLGGGWMDALGERLESLEQSDREFGLISVPDRAQSAASFRAARQQGLGFLIDTVQFPREMLEGIASEVTGE